MYVVLIARDHPDSLKTRLANREAHLRYLDETGKVFTAGPLLGAGGQPEGSLLILDVDDMDEAREWAANDPYALAGLFREVTLQAWKRVVG